MPTSALCNKKDRHCVNHTMLATWYHVCWNESYRRCYLVNILVLCNNIQICGACMHRWKIALLDKCRMVNVIVSVWSPLISLPNLFGFTSVIFVATCRLTDFQQNDEVKAYIKNCAIFWGHPVCDWQVLEVCHISLMTTRTRATRRVRTTRVRETRVRTMTETLEDFSKNSWNAEPLQVRHN